MKEFSKIWSIKEEWECFIIMKLRISIKFRNNNNINKTNKEKLEKIKLVEILLVVVRVDQVTYPILHCTLILRQNMMELSQKVQFEELTEGVQKKEEDLKM